MRIEARGKFTGSDYVWEDGKFTVEPRIKRKINTIAKDCEDNDIPLYLGSLCVGSENLKDFPEGAVALMMEVEPIKITNGADSRLRKQETEDNLNVIY